MPRRMIGINNELLLNRVVLRPERNHSRPPESLNRPFVPFVARNANDGEPTSGWFFPADRPTTLALVSPSNRGTKADALDHVAVLLECNCNVLVYDYRGFGDTPGLADVRTLEGDSQGVLAWALREGLWTPKTKTLVVGLSLGSLVAIRLAAADQLGISGIVLDGAIEPFRVLRRSFGPLGAATAEVACSQVPRHLNTEKQIQNVLCPALFIHGRQDDISTLDDAQHLASRTKRASLWVLDDCGHLDIITRHRDEYVRRLRDFIDGLVVR